MQNKILGLHHITAIAGEAQRNYHFYTKVLGLRMVKKTVNFDDPTTYHFYFGDEQGTPGTILTFFPWEGIQSGHTGTGMATETGYAVPPGSLSVWKERFHKAGVRYQETSTRFGAAILPFQDPDGLKFHLVESADERKPWTTSDTNASVAIRGFHNIELTLRNRALTASILTDIFGYTLQGQEGERYRYNTNAVSTASFVDIVEAPTGRNGLVAGGNIHHVAFRVKDEETLMAFREKVLARGLNITSKIDRNYFYSLYFREPGGVLFEIATDNPGFAVDEEVSELGTHLKLPSQYENRRTELEKVLPALREEVNI